MPMVQVDAAIIGGTGIGERLGELAGVPLHVPTARGIIRGKLVSLDGAQVFALRRHSFGHKVPPHAVNYEGFALACRALGVKACFATAAVGSMRPDWEPGTLVAPHDFVDLTGRNTTLFEASVVHTDFSAPFPARGRLLQSDVVDGGIYVCGNGPRYETPHEIMLYRGMGDIVGMTAASEAIAFREAGVAYGCLCIVTNLACGMAGTELNHEEVVAEMRRSGNRAMDVLRMAVRSLR